MSGDLRPEHETSIGPPPIEVRPSHGPDPGPEQDNSSSAIEHLIHTTGTVQAVLTALILAFVFRAFFVEPFIIPTGSMAEGLLGRHRHQICTACSWQYNVDEPDTSDETVICPNCFTLGRLSPESLAGDRILVHKWPYLLLAPKRWDVIVFRDPADPLENYIKRLVALPGESVEIIEGDIFINGTIARKPRYAQNALWIPVYDQGYVPRLPAGEHAPWQVDIADPSASDWSGLSTRVIRYQGAHERPQSIRFEPGVGEYLRDVYGYNNGSSGRYVNDVRLRVEIERESGSGTGTLQFEIATESNRFVAVLGPTGDVHLRRVSRYDENEVAQLGPVQVQGDFARVRLELAHVDHRVYVALNGVELLATDDESYPFDIDAYRHTYHREPLSLAMTADGGAYAFRNLRIERDVFYVDAPQTRRAGRANPMTLGPDEFFVLGDNSPDSHDSREWFEAGPHLPGDYRLGTVVESQIVGRAAFVYLPATLRVPGFSSRALPDIGRTRFIR